MKILVTGSTGFIGNYVIRELLKNNCQITATGRRVTEKVPYNWIEKVDYFPADLDVKRDNWFEFFGKPDCLIHLAWEGLPHYKQPFHWEDNLLHNAYFLKNMVQKGCRNLIVAGTCFEYGIRSGVLNEDLDTKPANFYALAKDSLRRYLELLQKKVDFDLKWLRLFYMYGKGQSPTSILSQLQASLDKGEPVFNMSGGEQLRDYLPVEKIAEYIVKIALQKKVTGIINTCSGKPVSIKQLVNDYLADNPKSIELNLGYYPYPQHEAMEFWGGTDKLKKAIEV